MPSAEGAEKEEELTKVRKQNQLLSSSGQLLAGAFGFQSGKFLSMPAPVLPHISACCTCAGGLQAMVTLYEAVRLRVERDHSLRHSILRGVDQPLKERGVVREQPAAHVSASGTEPSVCFPLSLPSLPQAAAYAHCIRGCLSEVCLEHLSVCLLVHADEGVVYACVCLRRPVFKARLANVRVISYLSYLSYLSPTVTL